MKFDVENKIGRKNSTRGMLPEDFKDAVKELTVGKSIYAKGITRKEKNMIYAYCHYRSKKRVDGYKYQCNVVDGGFIVHLVKKGAKK